MKWYALVDAKYLEDTAYVMLEINFSVFKLCIRSGQNYFPMSLPWILLLWILFFISLTFTQYRTRLPYRNYNRFRDRYPNRFKRRFRQRWRRRRRYQRSGIPQAAVYYYDPIRNIHQPLYFNSTAEMFRFLLQNIQDIIYKKRDPQLELQPVVQLGPEVEFVVFHKKRCLCCTGGKCYEFTCQSGCKVQGGRCECVGLSVLDLIKINRTQPNVTRVQ